MVDMTWRGVSCMGGRQALEVELRGAAFKINLTLGLTLIFWMRTGPATKRNTLGVTKSTISSAVMPSGMLLLPEPGARASAEGGEQRGAAAAASERLLTRLAAQSQCPNQRRGAGLVLLLRLEVGFVDVRACQRTR